jgi:hypothetical protein
MYEKIAVQRSYDLPEVTLSKHFSRALFLISLVLVAVLGAGAMHLLQAHAGSHHAQLAVGYCLAILGVFWIRSLERRLIDAGLPRWSFWPYFLVVFTACFGGHTLKIISGPETLGLFLLLQLPAMLFQSQPLAAESLPQAGAPALRKPVRPVAPISAVEFTVHLFLLGNLWNVLHLLYSDVSGFTHVKTLRIALNAGSWLLLTPWFFSVRGRLKAMGRLRWTMHFCALTLIPCLLLYYFREMRFLQALVLFGVLQIPVILLRREWISARLIPEDQDF